MMLASQKRKILKLMSLLLLVLVMGISIVSILTAPTDMEDKTELSDLNQLKLVGEQSQGDVGIADSDKTEAMKQAETEILAMGGKKADGVPIAKDEAHEEGKVHKSEGKVHKPVEPTPSVENTTSKNTNHAIPHNEKIKVESPNTSHLVDRATPKNSELVEEPTTAVVEEQGSESVDEVVCYSAGPFKTKNDANQFAFQVGKREIESRIGTKMKREKIGYWVYLEPERSLALARLKAEEIKLKGLKDVAVVVKSKPKWALSLGVFHYKKTAEERVAKVKGLGYQPKMSVRYNVERQYRVDMRMQKSNEPAENEWKNLIEGKKDLLINSIECK
ncbi:MAG: hypothetical protein OEZ43_17145 [Gammaproteobacteria bacterium]|nr:hypothetical protein [Gammaproteobacteria bacterium]